ncbi:hypothetical protein [Paenibacillus sp. YIM B09110]|uniref:hypothetical protein n=1 Tax=Paenibacillus sp. YIM B09110 TaxID=3126102 RepID=UPI00301B9AAD
MKLDIDYINRFFAESFPDGVYARELRLSLAEADYLREQYPRASLLVTDTAVSPDGKRWYEVRLRSG